MVFTTCGEIQEIWTRFFGLKQRGFTPPTVFSKTFAIADIWAMGPPQRRVKFLWLWQPLRHGKTGWKTQLWCPADSLQESPVCYIHEKAELLALSGLDELALRYMCWNLSEIHWHTREWFTVSHLKLLRTPAFLELSYLKLSPQNRGETTEILDVHHLWEAQVRSPEELCLSYFRVRLVLVDWHLRTRLLSSASNH